jgi:predicted PolB exonuclease-like 3'-5' exonuclease
MNLIFDIETGALPADTLMAQMPDFEPAVNLKDPEKIRADVERKRQKWLDSAALSPLTGRVLAIGSTSGFAAMHFSSQDDEEDILRDFWGRANQRTPPALVGWNIRQFDLPFLLQRSWIYGIQPPAWLRRQGRWSVEVNDLRDIWTCGDPRGEGSLDEVARHLGLPRKLGDGADFARLLATDHERAIEYLGRDVEIVVALARRIAPWLRVGEVVRRDAVHAIEHDVTVEPLA